jgi:hypothetical protein
MKQMTADLTRRNIIISLPGPLIDDKRRDKESIGVDPH